MRELESAKPELGRIGIVGAGRSRDGLGPFLAGFLETEGFSVSGVSGRSLERAMANAQTIGQLLGHEVRAFASPAALCANGIGALVICSPVEAHLEALRAAAATGLPTLCEKPLVHESHTKEAAEIIEIFSDKGLPLVENCQWPYVLSAFSQLHGTIDAGKQLTVEMGLAPRRPGREMVQNTISHLLSVIQAIIPDVSGAVVSEVRIADPTYKTKQNLLQFRLSAPGTNVEASLHLEFRPTGPRSAWMAINNRRIDRSVGQGYSISFSANGKQVAIDDPTKKLVNDFARLVRNRDPVLIQQNHDRIRQRFEWYRQILDRLE